MARIGARIAADFRRDTDLLRKLAEDSASLAIGGAFQALNLGPLAMSRHEFGIPFYPVSRLAKRSR